MNCQDEHRWGGYVKSPLVQSWESKCRRRSCRASRKITEEAVVAGGVPFLLKSSRHGGTIVLVPWPKTTKTPRPRQIQNLAPRSFLRAESQVRIRRSRKAKKALAKMARIVAKRSGRSDR